MGQTKVEFADHVWNPWIVGDGVRTKTSGDYWREPLKWNRAAEESQMEWNELRQSPQTPQPPRPRVFCASLCDVFEDWKGPIVDHCGNELRTDEEGWYGTVEDAHNHDESPVGKVWHKRANLSHLRRDWCRLIDNTPNVDWLVRTKHPENIRRMIYPRDLGEPDQLDFESGRDPNASWRRSTVWLGVSASNQTTYDEAIRSLMAIRDLASVIFLSLEPLGPINMRLEECPYRSDCYAPADCNLWVICGGERGRSAWPMHPQWARDIRDQCQAAGVPFFFEGWGEWGVSGQCPNDGTGLNIRESIWLAPDGATSNSPTAASGQWANVIRVGKKAAGRLLDGRTWDEVPSVEN